MFFRQKPTTTEEEWIAGCRKQEPKAQEKLYRQYYGYAMTIALQYAGNEEEAVEILNDSFLKVFSKITTYDSNYPFKGWLRRIVVNTAIDYYRKAKKIGFQVALEDVKGEETSTEMTDKLTAEDILKLLHQLPEVQRMVFNLYEIEGYAHEEIAEQLGISEAVSRVYLSRAKQKLKVLVEKYFDKIIS
jgi:RNA polymerase sigma factor (sigma-70 family)